MSAISHFLRYEFRRFKGLSRVALVFILLVPSLYGGIYLAANWDLYDNIDQVRVAVINHDRPAKFESVEVRGGEQFVQALKDRPVFDWVFLDDDDEAASGLADGEYFMTITVPEDFSANLTSVGNYDPRRAKLILHRDDANGFIIGTLTGKAEDALAKTLDASVADAYFRALFGSLDQIKNGMVGAATGAGQLSDGLDKVTSGVALLHDEVTGAAERVAAAKGGLAGVEENLTKVEGAIDQAGEGMGKVRDGALTIGVNTASAVGEVRTAAGYVSQLATHSLETIPAARQQAQQLVADHALITGGETGLLIKHRHHSNQASRAGQALLATHPELAEDPNVQDLLNELAEDRRILDQLAERIAAVESSASAIKAQLDSVDVEGAARGATAALDNARTSAEAAAGGVERISEGTKQVDGSLTDVRDALRSLTGGARELAAAAPQALDGALKLSDAIGTLNTAMPQLAEGAHKLAEGLDEGAKRLPDLTDAEQQSLAVTMSSPVEFEQVVDHDAKYYGRGLAPMFFSIALWIVTVSAFLVVRTISGRALTGRGNPLRIAATGLGPLAAVSLVGALAMGLGLWPLLGIDPVHPWLYLLLLTVASLSFIALAYAVRIAAGSPQTAIFLVWLVLQLAACGGVFPVTMLGPFFRALAPVSPMWYSVTAFRVAISGGQLSTYWMCIGVLGAIFVASTAVSVLLVRRRQRFRMRDLHPPMVTSKSTADFAFSVRPR